MKLMYSSKTLKFRSYITIKFQGNSTMNYPKKNYTIKLFEDSEYTIKYKVKFKNWPNQNKFVLKANWIDITQARNVVGAKIWSQIVSERDDYDTLPSPLTSSPNNGAIDGFMCKVYVNGIYQGRYNLNYGKDAIMFGDECEGVLTSDDYTSGCFRKLSTFTEGTDWTIEYPDEEDFTETHKTTFNNLIQLCIDKDSDKFKANVSEYADIMSLIDYECFGRIMTHIDGFGKNQIFLCYNGKYYASVYDMDSTFGLYWDGSKILSESVKFQDEYETGVHSTSNLLYDLLDKAYFREIYARYKKLRTSALSEESMISQFEDFMCISPKELIEEDYAATTANGRFINIPSKSITNIQQLRDNIVKRCKYCDTEMETLYNEYITVKSVTIKTDYSSLTVQMSTETPDAYIYYTVNGDDPTPDSSLYTEELSLNDGDIVKAYAVKNDMTDSPVTTYTFLLKAADPVITLNSVYGDAEISCETDSAKIYYTLDGTEPSTDSSIYDTSSRIDVDDNATITCFAVLEGYDQVPPSNYVSKTMKKTQLENVKYINNKITSFNGTSDYINTNVKLFGEDQPQTFQVIIDFTLPDPITDYSGSYTRPIITCMQEINPWPGFIIGYDNLTTLAIISNARNRVNLGDVTNLNGLNIKVVLEHINENEYTHKVYIEGVEHSTYLSSSAFNNYSTFDLPCLIGATFDSDGSTLMRYVKFTLNSCLITTTPITDESILKEALRL